MALRSPLLDQTRRRRQFYLKANPATLSRTFDHDYHEHHKPRQLIPTKLVLVLGLMGSMVCDGGGTGGDISRAGHSGKGLDLSDFRSSLVSSSYSAVYQGWYLGLGWYLAYQRWYQRTFVADRERAASFGARKSSTNVGAMKYHRWYRAHARTPPL